MMHPPHSPTQLLHFPERHDWLMWLQPATPGDHAARFFIVRDRMLLAFGMLRVCRTRIYGHMPPPTVLSLHLRTTSTSTLYPPSLLRALPSLSLLGLASANPMRKSASRTSLSVPVGWMASMLPRSPQLTVLLSSPSLSRVPCLPSMLCVKETLTRVGQWTATPNRAARSELSQASKVY